MNPILLLIEFGARAILLLLLGLSVWSVAIMLDRRRVFRQVIQSAAFLEKAKAEIAQRNWSALQAHLASQRTGSGGADVAAGQPGALQASLSRGDGDGIYAQVIRAALQTPTQSAEAIEHAVRSVLATERIFLEKGLSTLATLGSNAPFIGLFGTVLGIIQAFAVLGSSGSSTSSVMSGISEALVATAVGLFVAIPAVVAYNVFSTRLRVIFAQCESLLNLYCSRLDG